MPTCPAPLCNVTILEAKKFSQHRSRYHATPVLVNLPNGDERQVVNLPEGGYECWCGKRMEIRESCIEHVRGMHLGGVKAQIFTKANGKFYDFVVIQTFH